MAGIHHIVTLDLSKQLMHADMLGVGQLSNLINYFKKILGNAFG
jgi:hypothetical protein